MNRWGRRSFAAGFLLVVGLWGVPSSARANELTEIAKSLNGPGDVTPGGATTS